MLYEEASKTFASVGGEHSSDAQVSLRVARVMEESGVSDDLCFAAEADVRSSVVDVILVEVDDVLLECEDRVTCFKDLVEFGGCEIGEMSDVEFDSAGEEYFFFGFACFDGVLLGQLFPDFAVEKLMHGFKTFVRLQSAIEFVHPFLCSFVVGGISDENIDNRVDLAEFFAMRFLCFGSRFGIWRWGKDLLLTVASAIDLVVAFV